jgi:hypothetical protein
MRVMVVLLALLAAAKILAQERISRSGLEEALIAAYGDRAAQACQLASSPDPRALASPGPRPDWTKLSERRVVIGRNDVEVRLWELDNALWSRRFKHPFLVLEAPEGPGGSVCEYDLTLGRATLARR